MGIRFRNYRSRLHSYYVNLGRDEQYRRSKPASGVSQDNWQKICDRFESDDFKKLSLQNSQNRELQVVNHCAGTVSFVRFRENKRDPETGQEMGRINLYHGTHFSEKKGRWVAPVAQDNYDNMVVCQSQAEPEPEDDSIPPTEDEICDDVLGKRRGYTLGLGHGVMPSSSRHDRPSMEEIRINNEETNRRLEEAERRAEDVEMRRDELSIEMVNQARKIEELENWKNRLELFMSNFGPAYPSGMNA
ncbi:hypothetical protein ACHQM5_018073 [Ranunculus cassubicifolius]